MLYQLRSKSNCKDMFSVPWSECSRSKDFIHLFIHSFIHSVIHSFYNPVLYTIILHTWVVFLLHSGFKSWGSLFIKNIINFKNIFGPFFSPLCSSMQTLKVRQSRNDFIKLTFLQKSKFNFITMIPQIDLFLFGFFFQEIEDTTKTFRT